MRLLINARANSNKARNDNGTTPLFKAAEKDHVEVVRLLIKAGADINTATTDDFEAIPLYIAAQNGHDKVASLLIKAGTQINRATANYGTAPLFIAAQGGHVQVVCLLIKAGADMNKSRTDAAGETPLYVAACRS